MSVPDPTAEEYLCVVSEWSSYGHSGGRVGNAYPLLSVTRNDAVAKPMEEFPNPGAIFLTARGDLNVWDFILVRPTKNLKYLNASPRDCFYIPRRTPTNLDATAPDCRFATLLDVPVFDPGDSSGLVRNPSQGVTPLFYVRDSSQRIYGPLSRVRVNRTEYDTLASIQWAPFGEQSVIYEFTAESLAENDLRIVRYEHPDPNLNEVLKEPVHFIVGPVMTAMTGKAVDRVPETQLAEWYARWQSIEEFDEAFHRFFKSVAEHLAESTPEIIRQRCKRIGTLISRLEALEAERRYIARRFLTSDEGRRLVDLALQQEIERRGNYVDEEVRKRRSELSTEEREMARRLGELRDAYELEKTTLEQKLVGLKSQENDLTAGIAELEERLEKNMDRLRVRMKDMVPLFAALSSGVRPAPIRIEGFSAGPVAEPGLAVARKGTAWTDVVLPTPTRELDDAQDELAFVERLVDVLAADGLSFTRDFITNIFICYKSSPLNLVMGPPGHGKSSIVSALARALGHGGSLLEIAVRRSWSDDRHLLGFFDTFHGRFDPGPTGLTSRLLQAQRDWEQLRRGLYFVLLDEFNLSAPEYYFSQLLQLLARPQEQRIVHLFDPGMLPAASADTVHQLQLHPNLSFWGTINYDETTERLSPRLLDRTGMIFLNARDVAHYAADYTAGRGAKGISADRLCENWVRPPEQCPEQHWDLMVPLLDLLKQQTEDWGAGIDVSPRVIDAVKRYLSNSRGLMIPAKAVDFAFQQRVLPVVRGRGPQFAARIRNGLQQKLADAGFERSARHVRDTLALADANFGDIDFLAYS